MMAHSLDRFIRNIVEDLYWIEDEPIPTVDALHHNWLYINK